MDNKLQQTCKVCGRLDKFDYNVPNHIWRQVVPKKYLNNVVCLACFDDFATQNDIDIHDSLHVFYFAGSRVALELQVTRSSKVESYRQVPIDSLDLHSLHNSP